MDTASANSGGTGVCPVASWVSSFRGFQACPAGPQVKLSGGVIHPIWPSMLSWDPTGVAGKYWWGEGSLEYPA